jgi:hypothetical protein
MRTRNENGNLVIGNGGPTGGRVVIIELLKNSQEATEGAAAYRYHAVGPDMVMDVGGRLEDHSSYCDSS